MRYHNQEELSTWWEAVFRSLSFSTLEKDIARYSPMSHPKDFSKTLRILTILFDIQGPSHSFAYNTILFLFHQTKIRLCSVHLKGTSRIGNVKLWSMYPLHNSHFQSFDQEVYVKVLPKSFCTWASSMPFFKNWCETFIVHEIFPLLM